MKNQFDRRQFLKLSSLLPIPNLTANCQPRSNSHRDNNGKNILIVLFDAFSAKNIPFYGYPRNTTPNLAKILEKSIVYHNHYATGNYTTPGTASLLTGTLPWTHRAINLRNQVLHSISSHNIFRFFDDFYRIAYSHNITAHVFIRQFFRDLDQYLRPETLFLHEHWPGSLFGNDGDISKLSSRRIIDDNRTQANSLFLKKIYHTHPLHEWMTKKRTQVLKANTPSFPRGIPTVGIYDLFDIEKAIDWLTGQLSQAPQPFLCYFHLLPPHARYNTRIDFIDVFADDGYLAPEKPTHIFNDPNSNSPARYQRDRQQYDEYILYVDSEFKRLYDFLTDSGLIENTIVIFTSDHGEMFERGYHKHNYETLHQPVVQIPLIIFDPDMQQRVDIYESTSAVDIIPTLLYINGKETPEHAVGRILPPYATQSSTQDIFALQAVGNLPHNKINFASAMIVRDNLKLTYYFGYPALGNQDPYIELYNINEDSEELENLYRPGDETAKAMIKTLVSKLEKADSPYS